jgi:hypothetical protein
MSDADRRRAGPGRSRRIRGIGKGRRTRRSLARGGTGVAAWLNEALGGWPGVRISPMFGRWGYFVGPRLFACFPLRPGDADLWLRLSPPDQRRALTSEGVTPHRRFARRGWVECRVVATEDVPRALRWLRRSYEWTRQSAERPADE